MPRVGLSLKIFLGTAVVVSVLLVVTLVVTSSTAHTSALNTIARGLGATNARIVEQLQARQSALAGRVAVFAENRNAIETLLRDSVGNDAFDQAQEIAKASGARWVQVTDSSGARLAKSDEAAAPRGEDLTRSPLVSGALESRTMAGFGVSGDTAVMQVVAVPIKQDLDKSNSRVSGVIMAAQPVGDSLATAIGTATGSEVVFYVIDSTGHPHVAGSTVDRADRDGLQQVIAERMLRAAPAASATTPATADANPPPAAATGAAGKSTDIQLAGRQYVGQSTPLLNARGAAVGGFLALRSLDAELAPYRALRRTLLITGALGLMVAFLLSGVVAQQIVRPVKSLVSATRRAADGDYAAEIPVGGSDEIGTLADAVRRLLGDLRDKQALVDFLGGGQAASTSATSSMSNATLIRGTEATVMMHGAGAPDGVLQPGQSLGVRYEVKSLLGAGGMGMVYRAVDRELQEVVAIKTLKPELIASDTTALERFKSEIRLARKISHRNVVRTHDLGESRGLYFITMEFVEGKSLKELVRLRGRLPVQVMLPIAKQLCRALEVAHEAGVIHRDIKPQNMVVEGDGTLKVMDFGIARLAKRKPSQGLTEVGTVIGTPEYMAPEQLLGDEIDARADIYSAGVVMYECLTGRPPFEAPSPMVLIAKVLDETADSPHALHAEIPVGLSAIVMKAMAREREARPASAKALHDALEALG
jgi:HAMP domain-containing protein/predicted Ser/Thr protein kinase